MSQAAEIIAGEIRKKGAIPFARFMELALYCPNCGYYEREEDMIGRRGDYFTGVSVGSLFGELLAFQFAEWLEPSRLSRASRIVEAGAHRGDLAGDVLRWMLRYRPTLFDRLEYWIIEPSERRRAWQREKLAAFGGRVHWVGEVAGVRGSARVPNPTGVQAVIFCNELLDAMPVHRMSWDAAARTWFEWGVTLRAGRFAWTRLTASGAGGEEPTTATASAVPRPQPSVKRELLQVLPDGFSTELCPAAERWWHEAARVLEHGKLLAIDYGLTAEEFSVPERREGTLRAYRCHRPSNDVLAHPGEQDITAHVNFTALRAAGEAVGLKTDTCLTQAQFLTGIAARTWQAEGAFGEWTSERTRQFQTLTHPEHLGRSFRVLVQSRG